MAKVTILLADNNQHFAEVQAEVLKTEGYQVLIALSPVQARELLGQGGIDLAILDLRLANDDDERDRSGLVVAKEVAPSVPKILLTAYPAMDAAREALRPSPDGHSIAMDFIDKYQGPKALIDSIERLIATRIHKMIKILFLAANPKDTSRLRLDEEVRAIDQALLQAEFRDRFDIRQHWAVRVFDIQGYLLRHNPDIVHFSGHGSSSSEIILEDNVGDSHPVPPRALGQLFSVLKDNIRCVVLNACYSERQAKAIAEHIDCVVGMSRSISDPAAIGFAASFYQGLGYGRSIKTAFDLGCIQIDLESLGEQNTPKLLAIRSNPEDIVFVSTDE